MEGAGSIAEEGRGSAGAIPPSLEPVPAKSNSVRVLGRGPAALFMFGCAEGRNEEAWDGSGAQAGGKAALPGRIRLRAWQEAGWEERFPKLPWLGPCFPTPRCDVPQGSSPALAATAAATRSGGDRGAITPFWGRMPLALPFMVPSTRPAHRHCPIAAAKGEEEEEEEEERCRGGDG